MSREATNWAYGPNVLGLDLTANELALLRAVCWSMHPALGRTKPLTNAELTRLTGISSPQSLLVARKRLRSLGLLAFEHANRLPAKAGMPALKTIGYVYAVRFRERS